MKIVIAALAAIATLSAVAATPAAAQPYGPPGHHDNRGPGYERGRGPGYRPGGWRHPRPHRVCFIRHHHRVCRWVR